MRKDTGLGSRLRKRKKREEREKKERLEKAVLM